MKKRSKIISVILALVMMQSFVLCTISASAASSVAVPSSIKITKGDQVAKRSLSYDTSNKKLTITTKRDGQPYQPDFDYAFLPANNNSLLLRTYGYVPEYALSKMVTSGKITTIVEKFYNSYASGAKVQMQDTIKCTVSSGKVTKITIKRYDMQPKELFQTLTYTFTYDSNKRMTKMVSKNQIAGSGTDTLKTAFSYNNSGKLSKIAGTNDTYTVKYNSKGKPTQVSKTGEASTVSTDSKGRITALRGYGFQYDSNGRLSYVWDGENGFKITYKTI